MAGTIRIRYDLDGIGPSSKTVLYKGKEYTYSYYTVGVDGDWESAPRYGVIQISAMDPDNPGKAIAIHAYSPSAKREACPTCGWKPQGGEYYVKCPTDKMPYTTGVLAPFLDKVDKTESQAYRDGLIKDGRAVDTDLYEAILEDARNDGDFPY